MVPYQIDQELVESVIAQLKEKGCYLSQDAVNLVIGLIKEMVLFQYVDRVIHQADTILDINPSYTEKEIVEALAKNVVEFLGAEAASIRIYNPRKEEMVSFGRLRYTVAIDFVSMVISVVLSFILVPQYGAVGAAIATCGTLVLYNILNQLGLKYATKINFIRLRYLTVYLSVIVGTVILFIFQRWVSNNIYVDLAFAALTSLILLVVNRSYLQVEHTFPELLRWPVVRFLFETNTNKAGRPNEEILTREHI